MHRAVRVGTWHAMPDHVSATRWGTGKRKSRLWGAQSLERGTQHAEHAVTHNHVPAVPVFLWARHLAQRVHGWHAHGKHAHGRNILRVRERRCPPAAMWACGLGGCCQCAYRCRLHVPYGWEFFF